MNEKDLLRMLGLTDEEEKDPAADFHATEMYQNADETGRAILDRWLERSNHLQAHFEQLMDVIPMWIGLNASKQIAESLEQPFELQSTLTELQEGLVEMLEHMRVLVTDIARPGSHEPGHAKRGDTVTFKQDVTAAMLFPDESLDDSAEVYFAAKSPAVIIDIDRTNDLPFYVRREDGESWWVKREWIQF